MSRPSRLRWCTATRTASSGWTSRWRLVHRTFPHGGCTVGYSHHRHQCAGAAAVARGRSGPRPDANSVHRRRQDAGKVGLVGEQVVRDMLTRSITALRIARTTLEPKGRVARCRRRPRCAAPEGAPRSLDSNDTYTFAFRTLEERQRVAVDVGRCGHTHSTVDVCDTGGSALLRSEQP
jgi:hypothetical protein